MSVELDRLHRTGVRLLVGCGLGGTLFLKLLAYIAGVDAAGPAALVAFIIMAPPAWAAWRRRHGPDVRLMLGIAAAVLPAALVYGLRGHPWQMDAHIFFFVGLAALVVLADWRALVVSAAVTAAHHAVLLYAAPAWVFAGAGDLGRVVVHAVAVVLQAGVLVHFVRTLSARILAQEAAQGQSAALARAADDSRAAAERALADAVAARASAKAERDARERAEHDAAASRRAQMLQVADAFEAAVLGVVDQVGGASARMERAAAEMSGLAGATGRGAAEVAGTSAQASQNAQDVAQAVAALSHSIGEIADSVSRQADLGQAAAANSAQGDEAIRQLSDRSADVGAITGTVGTIAAHTNRLALNATIEAARAGAAGRSFAVVAGEVKSLAAQAADATGQIRTLVHGMQEGAGAAERSLGAVKGALAELAGAAGAIGQAIDEQRAAAERIERNAAESAHGADATASAMQAVARAAAEADALAKNVRQAAGDLAGGAHALRASTADFLRTLRAA